MWRIVILVILVFILFAPIYSELFHRFTERDSYYSHGFIIPFLSFYLVWRKRKVLKNITPQPCIWGLIYLIFSLLVYLISLVLKINFLSYFSLPLVIFSIVLYLGGRKITREIIFPIVFLIFMLPLPSVVIIGIAFHLKILAAKSAVFLVKLLGMEVIREGSTIYYPGGYLLVGDPCSGIRSLIAFLALGAFFSQFMLSNWIEKFILFVSSIFIAFFSNVVRVIFLLLVSYIYGKEVALGFIHDFSGIMVFILGFLGLWGISKLLRCRLVIESI
ncbi:MAG: exosortase/archaeosortase family protein [Candidatus Omnitrophica bacterium]|nr:exosortase/archaeosortase family protein [Candidatus Omnitrophota bacterium]